MVQESLYIVIYKITTLSLSHMHTVFHGKSPLACISLTNIFAVHMFAGLDQMICLSPVTNKCFQMP